MTAQDYTRTCQVCDTEYQPTLKKDGTPRKTKYNACSVSCRQKFTWRNPSLIVSSIEIERPCEWCGSIMLLKAAQKAQQACGVSCREHAKSRRQGKQHRPRGFHCSFCHRWTNRKIRSVGEASKYCGRSCSFFAKSLVSKEREALRRIGARRKALAHQAQQSSVVPEIRALKRIAGGIRLRTADCLGCGESHIRRYKFSRHCSESCGTDYRARARDEHKRSDANMAQRRIAKSKRRALMRNTQAESIDPFDVFDRDKWRCHLCGINTLKSLRGTYEDRAPELEHKIPLSRGGPHTWENVACSCRKCNQEKGDSIAGQLFLNISM